MRALSVPLPLSSRSSPNFVALLSSALVRSAVFRGLAFVLENHLSHGLLKLVLPQLAPLLHDKAEKVQSEHLSS